MGCVVKLFSQACVAQSFQINIKYYTYFYSLFITDSLKNYLFLSVGLTKKTKPSTQLGAIPYILSHMFYMGFARDLPSGLLHFVENFTKSGVSVRKRQAVHLLNTLKISN